MDYSSRNTKAELIACLDEMSEELNELKAEIAILKEENEALKAENSKLNDEIALLSVDAGKQQTCSEREGKLRALIELSCNDHCPYQNNENKCKNCTIKAQLDELG